MTRFVCPTSSTVSIIEERPQPTASTSKPARNVYQRGRFVCPGSTIIEEAPQPQPVAPTSRAVPVKPKRVIFNTDKGKGKALKPNQRAIKKEHIIDARRKDQLRHKLALDRNPTNYVFVGNLDYRLTEADLRLGFAECGHITRVIFRCSQGRLHPPTNKDSKRDSASTRDRMYATVEFRHFQSVKKALQCNGMIIPGQQAPIKVCASAADLPEVNEIANYYIRKMKSDSTPTPTNRWFNMASKKNVAPQPTEAFIDFTKPANDKFCILSGFSFPKSII